MWTFFRTSGISSKDCDAHRKALWPSWQARPREQCHSSKEFWANEVEPEAEDGAAETLPVSEPAKTRTEPRESLDSWPYRGPAAGSRCEALFVEV